MFTVKSSIILCFICWIIGVIIDLPNIVSILIGHNPFSKEDSTKKCFWESFLSKNNSLEILIFSICMPCFVIMLFYIRIFVFVTVTRSHLKSENYVTQRKKIKSKSLKIAMSLFASFSLFAISWYVYFVFFFFNRKFDT
jgi:hypothetical protein